MSSAKLAMSESLSSGNLTEAFVAHLGWTRWTFLGSTEIPDLDRLPAGWQTRQSTQELIKAAPKQQFAVHGVARLEGQVVLACVPRSQNFWPTHRQRKWICLDLARKFYQPLVVFSRGGERHQTWCLPKRSAGPLGLLEFDILSESDLAKLADSVANWQVTGANLRWATNNLEVQRTVETSVAALAEGKQWSRKARFVVKFAPFGAEAVKLAKHAWHDRIWEQERMFALAALAKDGDREAYDRVFRAHMFLVMERAREFCIRRRLIYSEFGDYVSAASLGIASGMKNYTPDRGYLPSTLIYHHIEKCLHRAYPKLELASWIPVHRHERLLMAARSEGIAYDCLYRQLRREPELVEVLEEVGLCAEDATEYLLFNLARHQDVWCTDIGEMERCEESTIARQLLHQPPLRSDEIGALVRLENLPDRHRKALMMRTGLEPGQDGQPARLEDIAEALGVTRERARQLLMKAEKMAREWDENAQEPPRRQKRQPIVISYEEDKNIPPGTVQQPAPQEPQVKDSLPSPPFRVRKANAYIEWILETHGCAFEPQQVHAAVRYHFPSSIIGLENIYAKYHRRGWTRQQPVLSEQA